MKPTRRRHYARQLADLLRARRAAKAERAQAIRDLETALAVAAGTHPTIRTNEPWQWEAAAQRYEWTARAAAIVEHDAHHDAHDLRADYHAHA
jgi:hypothetical protein